MINLDGLDRDLLIRTVIGEANNEPPEGKKAVAHVVLNRMAKEGGDVQSVLFRKNQFEPWETRREELMRVKPTSDAYKNAAAIVDGVLAGEEDITGGATHFLNESVVRDRRGGTLPDWAKGKGQRIGHHTFHAPEGRVSRSSAPDGQQPLRVTIRPEGQRAPPNVVAGPPETAMGSSVEEVTDPAILEQLGLGGRPSPTASPAAIPEASVEEVTDPAILNQLMGGGEEADSPETAPTTPEAPLEKGRDVGIGGAYVTGFASDENETLRYLAHQLYPNEPIEQAVKRFGSRDGVLYHKGDDGKLYEAVPGSGWGLRDISGWLASYVGKGIPALSGLTAGAVTAPLAATGIGLAGTMAAAGAGTAAGEVARQKVGDVMMGDASTGDLNVREVMTEGTVGALGQGIGAGVGHMITRNAVRDIDKLNPATTAQAYDEAARAGVQITPAEATGLPTLAAQQKRLTNITPTADEMRAFLAERDNQVIRAWSNFLDNISQAADAEDVGRMGRDAAQGALAEMRASLSAAAKPLYEAAYAKAMPLNAELQELAKRPVMKDAMARAAKLAENEGMPFNPANPGVRGWDYVKRGLDEILGSAEVVNQKTGGFNNYGRIVQNIKADMLRIVDEAVPEYAQARAVYSDGAEDVTSAMQSALNTLAKTKDTAILDAAKHIFNPRTRSPQMVLTLKRALATKNPEAWQALKRLYIQDVTLDALRVAEQGEVLNPAGKLHKAFINPRLRENLRAAMEPEEWQAMNDLLVVFKRAASVPALRSDTEFNRQMTEEAAEAARPLLAKITRNANPAQALRSVSDWLTNRSLEKKAKQAVALITSGDPSAIKAMKELKRLSPLDRRWLTLFGHLVSRSGNAGVGAIVPDADYAPGQ